MDSTGKAIGLVGRAFNFKLDETWKDHFEVWLAEEPYLMKKLRL